VLNVPYLTDGGPALPMKLAQFTRRELEHRILTLLAYNLGRISCAVHKLAPFAWLKLDIVYQSSRGNEFQRQSIPGLYIDTLTRLYGITQLDLQRSEYIALLSISIMN
jgi:hypothetical protein